MFYLISDTIDSIKQNAALCLLKLIRIAPDFIIHDDWTVRVIHLLNDQHLVRLLFIFESNICIIINYCARRKANVLFINIFK